MLHSVILRNMMAKFSIAKTSQRMNLDRMAPVSVLQYCLLLYKWMCSEFILVVSQGRILLPTLYTVYSAKMHHTI